MLTDGKQSKSPYENYPLNIDFKAASKPLKDIGVQIYTVILGKDYNLFDMLDISSSDEKMFRAANLNNLDKLAAKISNSICKGTLKVNLFIHNL